MFGRSEFCGTGADRGRRRGGITGGVSASRCLRKESPCGPFENTVLRLRHLGLVKELDSARLERPGEVVGEMW